MLSKNLNFDVTNMMWVAFVGIVVKMFVAVVIVQNECGNNYITTVKRVATAAPSNAFG